jgi:hypothetical protein
MEKLNQARTSSQAILVALTKTGPDVRLIPAQYVKPFLDYFPAQNCALGIVGQLKAVRQCPPE